MLYTTYICLDKASFLVFRIRKKDIIIYRLVFIRLMPMESIKTFKFFFFLR